ncbi:alanine racemase [Methylocapsa sp. S129]|uniref:alanine racemase n=1 Tax=Methylocapsa sp. S129 TaxID=1641869 RepID=UPI00131A999A|nr:alanine racemase [Methylocapsa sp. S129]
MSADPYFLKLSEALRSADIHQPCLVLDLERLDANIAIVKSKLAPGLRLRIVDKSLPCVPLLSRIRDAFGADLFMTFHLPISAAVLEKFPAANLLLGKPMPVAGLRRALTEGALADPSARARIVWLIDTDERLASYGALAEELGVDLSFCFEVDVGLHRGGYPNPDALLHALKALASHPRLQCVGIMAYEAHIGHIPGLFGGPARALAKTKIRLQLFATCLAPHQRAILNLGGSSTALLYDGGTGANEISMGSAFVLPTDFDVPSLSALKPAALIATPILKVVDAQVPGLDESSWILQKLGLFPRRGCFLYGGKWMAKPVYPTGMKPNKTMGFSTNQQFMALPDDTQAKPDDYAFLRPTQSEFVLQQFGPIAVFSRGRIVDRWPVLAPS